MQAYASIDRSHYHDGRSNQALAAERLGSVTFGNTMGELCGLERAEAIYITGRRIGIVG
jgi:hypothetical protein